MSCIKINMPCLPLAVLYAVIVLLLSGCAMNGRQSLMIDARKVPAVQYMPQEITSMLDDLGYRVIRDPDPAKTVERYAEYRLQFRARDAETVRIDVHIRMLDNVTGVHLYNSTENKPGADTMQRFNELKKRVQLQFGAKNVTDNRPFRTP